MPPYSDLQTWLGLAIALVLVASAGPGPARLVRYTLGTVILYVILTHTSLWAPWVAKLNLSLPVGNDPIRLPARGVGQLHQ